MHLVQVKTFSRNGIVLESCLMAGGCAGVMGAVWQPRTCCSVPAAAREIEFFDKLITNYPRFG